MKILTVVGTRPQLIKVAAVSRHLRKSFTEVLVNTGQHYDYNMAGVFFEQLPIPKPDYDLGVGSLSHGKQTGQMMIKLEDVMEKESPDAVIVYGDTNSTLAGALVASKRHIPVIHIEAGLRSFNKKMPEEINRIMTDHVSTLLFAPTKTAVKNLQKENITSGVYYVGDVMYDAVLHNTHLAETTHDLAQFNLQKKSYVLCTIHRAENTDYAERMEAIVKALIQLQIPVFLPLHPRTKQKLKQYNLFDKLNDTPHITVAEPVSYLEMLLLQKNATAIVTDSGGIQKEAYFAQVPCFTIRNETEWIETVDAGWNILVNPLRDDLKKQMNIFLEQRRSYNRQLYGNGNAGAIITETIKRYFA